MMLSPAWTGGGTDYGGCVGRHAAFSKATGYNVCDATMYYKPNFYPSLLMGKVVAKGRRSRIDAMGHLRPRKRLHPI